MTYPYSHPMMKRSGQTCVTRREFLGQALTATALLSTAPHVWSASASSGLVSCPIVVFSKIYQELKLNFDEAADLTAEAGLDGIDCPVRPGGEILPEAVADRLPAYNETLTRRKLSIKLLTTAITNPSTPGTELILRTAAKLGIRYYRLGFFKVQKGGLSDSQAAGIRSGLKDLAQLNKELGMCALFQNHGGSVGANLGEMLRVLEGFSAEQVGAAFDIGHALAVHGRDWTKYFERIKPHLKIAYVKDAKIGGSWVPFGTGDIATSGFFQRLAEMNYSAPLSLHIEFDWSDRGKSKTREALLRALSSSRKTLQEWVGLTPPPR